MKICLVTTDLMGFVVNGGVGTANFHLGQFLSKENKVDILFVHDPKKDQFPEYMAWKNEYKKLNINVLSLEYPRYQIESQFLFLTRSYIVYKNLVASKYDIILFPEMHGLGHYTFLAKKLKNQFQKTKLVTMYHGPSEWHHRYNKGLPSTFSELVKYFLEKQSCLNSDHVYFATNHAKKIASEIGYYIPRSEQTSEVLLYPFDSTPFKFKKIEIDSSINEICFLGRVESRKGIETFMDAIAELSIEVDMRKCKITILGKIGSINSKDPIAVINKWGLENQITFNLVSDFSTYQAFEYIKNRNAIVVLPSVEETMGYTLIESIVNSTHCVCSDIPPFVEIINHFEAKNVTTFKSKDSRDLAQKLLKKLKSSIPARAQKMSSAILMKKWNKSLKALAEIKVESRQYKKFDKISICIVYFDRPRYLAQLLFALDDLANIADEILIYVNRADLKDSKGLLQELESNRRIKLIYGIENVAPGAARNALAKQAKNETLFFIDDDNLPDTSVIRSILGSGFNEWDIICSPLKKINGERIVPLFFAKGTKELQQHLNEVTEAHWLPMGDEKVLNIIENRIGDCNFLVKKSQVLSIGGFNETLYYGEDQEFLLRSVYRNSRYFLSPESFVFYRYHKTNLTRKVDHRKEALNSMEKILNSLKLNEFVPVLQMLKAWDFEKDRNPDWAEIGRIADYSGERSIQGELKMVPLGGLKKYIKNRIVVFKKNKLIEIELPSHTGVKAVNVRKMTERALELHVFSKTKIEIFASGRAFEVRRGHTKIIIPLEDANPFEITCALPHTIYIFSAMEVLKVKPKSLMFLLKDL